MKDAWFEFRKLYGQAMANKLDEDIMKDIIAAAYKEQYGEGYGQGEIRGLTYQQLHEGRRLAFTAGAEWMLEYMLEQEAMSKDYQEELQEQERLRSGQ